MRANEPATSPWPTVLRRTLVFALSGLIGGCTIGTPFDTQRVRATAPTGLVEVSITHAIVDPARRGDFDRWTRRVNGTLDGQPGLLAHAIRKELLGDNAWTFTVWASVADRERFVRSTAHRRAVDEASTGLAAMRSVRLTLAPADLPDDWDGVLALLERAAGEGKARAYAEPGPR